MTNRVKTNRKATNGRKIYYQNIFDKETGKRLKTIKHIQESSKKLKYAEKFIEATHRKMNQKVSFHPSTVAYRERKKQGTIIWNSGEKGTYIRTIHGKLI